MDTVTTIQERSDLFRQVDARTLREFLTSWRAGVAPRLNWMLKCICDIGARLIRRSERGVHPDYRTGAVCRPSCNARPVFLVHETKSMLRYRDLIKRRMWLALNKESSEGDREFDALFTRLQATVERQALHRAALRFPA